MSYSENLERFISFNNEINLNNYEKIEKIGKGQFSTVYKVKNKNTNIICAMKIVEKYPGIQSDT